MSEKLNKAMMGNPGSGATSKPVPMKFFATWEVDRTPSNCIPRLCSLTLSRLVVFQPLGSDLSSISIAVKMQSSKRTLRSNEISLPPSGLLDTGLEMTFCLQYPHFLKRDGNRLHVLLQRRKRYKNRTMLGYKTLAEGVIRMDQVLQRQMDMELELVTGEASVGGGSGYGGGGGSKGGDKATGSMTATAGNVQTVAKLTVLQLSSTPVDQQEAGTHNKTAGGRRVPSSAAAVSASAEYSDEEDEGEFSSGEEGEMSDSEPLRGTKLPRTTHQRHNLKQRFVSLLRRFRVPDTEASRVALGASLGDTSDIQALFQQLESLRCDEDSTGELDTVSISSTPKPSLRPFFSSSRSLLDATAPICTEPLPPGLGPPESAEEREKNSGSDGNADLCWTDYEQSDPQTAGCSPPRDRDPAKSRMFKSSAIGSAANSATVAAKKKNSLGADSTQQSCNEGMAASAAAATSRKSFLEQIVRVLPPDEVASHVPDSVVLVSGVEPQAGNLARQLTAVTGGPGGSSSHCRVLQPTSCGEVRAVLSTLLARTGTVGGGSGSRPVKVALVGGDAIVSSCLRSYVDLLSSRPPDWQSYFRFYVVPLAGSGGSIGGNAVARYLSSVDGLYGNLFPTDGPETSAGSGTAAAVKQDTLVARLQRYLSSATCPTVQLPIAEAMLTCQDESSQLFIPFVSEVRVGPGPGSSGTTTTASGDTAMSLSVELDDNCAAGAGGPLLSSSPPGPPLTPPSSPNVQTRELPWEPLELQLDYWQVARPAGGDQNRPTEGSKSGSKPDGGKCSLKGVFRSLQVSRLPPAAPGLTMIYTTKEKKQKIMRLGKKKEKERDSDGRSQTVEGISRLICSVKASHNAPMRVVIDGTDWTGVKFFQLSSTWQTHIKHLSVSLVGVPLATSELS